MIPFMANITSVRFNLMRGLSNNVHIDHPIYDLAEIFNERIDHPIYELAEILMNNCSEQGCFGDIVGCTPTGKTLNYMAFVCYNIILPVLVVVGVSGNVAVLRVFANYQSRNNILPIRLFVNLLMLSNITLLLVSFFQWFAIRIWKNLAVGLYLAYPLAHTFRCMSMWTNVAISIDRWFAVTRPLRHKVVCTPRRVICTLVLLILVSVLYNVPRAFEIKIRDLYYCDGSIGVGPQHDWLAHAVGYNLVYRVVMYFGLVLLAPFVLITILNVCIIMHLKKSHVARGTMCWRTMSRDHGTTVMLIAELVIFLMCNFLPVIMNMLDFLHDGAWVHMLIHHIVYVSNLLVLVNASMSFFVFFSFGSQFRSVVRKCIYRDSQKAIHSIRGKSQARTRSTVPSPSTGTRPKYGSVCVQSRFGIASDQSRGMVVKRDVCTAPLNTRPTLLSSSGSPTDAKQQILPSSYQAPGSSTSSSIIVDPGFEVIATVHHNKGTATFRHRLMMPSVSSHNGMAQLYCQSQTIPISATF